MNVNEYQTPDHALTYLARADSIPHRTEGEGALLSFVPNSAKRVLDLGTGDGRLLALLHSRCPNAEMAGIDFSATMVDAARTRFVSDARITIIEHDLNDCLPFDDHFDAIVSSFAIHHCTDERKRSLYAEIFDRLASEGVFCNLEHVAPPTSNLHSRFLEGMGSKPGHEDPSNILLDVFTQLEWLREIGFADVDCYWKWLGLALFGGIRA